MPVVRALVTGSSGFVGRYMCAELEARGYVVDRIDLQGPPFVLVDNIFSENNPLKMFDAVKLFNYDDRHYDLVVHCAYHVGGRAMIDGVPSVLSANVELDAALFRWAERTEPDRVIYFSSSAAYPAELQTEQQWATPLHMTLETRKEFMRLREETIRLDRVRQPDARYGWAKLNGEMLAAAYREIGGAVTVVRPFSGFAWDQSDDYPFPSIVKRAARGDLTVWGPPGQTRDWIHITDVVKGALAVADSGTADPVNLCTGVGTEMGELAEMIWHAAIEHLPAPPGYEANLYRKPEYLTDKPTGVFYRVGDPARMLEYYTPQVTLEQGIAEALAKIT